MLAEVLKKKSGEMRTVPLSFKLRDALVSALEESAKPQLITAEPGYPFRVSGLAYMCPRAHSLAILHQLPYKDEAVDPSLRWIFAQGTGIHHAMQEEILPHLGEVFQGWWKCHNCATVYKGEPIDAPGLKNGWIPIPWECDECGCRDFSYKELEFCCPEFRLTGHSDGILVWGYPDDEVLEIKSINERGFESVNPVGGGRAYPNHIAQNVSYQWLSGLRKGRILYVVKSDKKSIPEMVCEHPVEYDETLVTSVKSTIQSAIVGEAGGDLPPRMPECKTTRSKRVKECLCGERCFSE